MDQKETEDRFIALEIKLAHQERLTEELNDALYKQQQRMDALEKTLIDLQKRVQNGDQEIRPHEKPPHY